MKKLDKCSGKESAQRRRKIGQERNNCMLRLMKVLYRGVNGIQLASAHQKEKAINEKSLTYGEVQPQSFLSILTWVNAQRGSVGGTFVDLGCGTGMAVLSAALSACSFNKCWGIEIVPNLVDAALSCSTKLSQCIASAKSEPNFNATTSNNNDNDNDTIDNRRHDDKSSGFLDILRSVLDELSGGNLVGTCFDMESVVDKICKQYGHKTYKNMIKGKFKSFKKLVAFYSNEFSILSDRTFTVNESFTSLSNINVLESPCVIRADKKQKKHINLDNEVLDILCSRQGRQSILNQPLPEVKIELGDIFAVDWWSDADVVYCASLLFSNEMMRCLGEKVLLMKSGSYFVSLKPLEGIDPVVEKAHGKRHCLVSDSFYKMSWQMARVFIYSIEPLCEK